MADKALSFFFFLLFLMEKKKFINTFLRVKFHLQIIRNSLALACQIFAQAKTAFNPPHETMTCFDYWGGKTPIQPHIFPGGFC